MSEKDYYFLDKTIQLAIESVSLGQFPYSAILVYEDTIVHQSIDKSVSKYDPTAHSELTVIREFCQLNRLYYLNNYTLYCNAEPCAMCAGAIYYSGISRLVFGVSRTFLSKYWNSPIKEYNSCKNIIIDGKNNPAIIGPVFMEREGEPFSLFKNKDIKSRNVR